MSEAEHLNDDQLLGKLSIILRDWPLYRVFRYTDAALNKFPDKITMPCPNCRKQQNWEQANRGGWVSDSTCDSVKYWCKNCEMSVVTFYFAWCPPGKTNPIGSFIKVGQDPAPEERIDSDLEKQLEGEDLDFYRKALRCRSFNYGLGAVAYLRRVVENRMNMLLDSITEAAQEAGSPPDEFKDVESVKTSRQFDDKVSYAAKILPDHLKPGGINPIDALHDIASEGLHRKSDGDCIDIFDESRLVFEHLFKELKIHKETARSFVQKLRGIAERKSKPVKTK